MLTELEYVKTEFPSRFAGREHLRFLLHGSRDYAAAILDAYGSRFSFAGVTTFDELPGHDFHGSPVRSRDEALRMIADHEVDAVILTERVKHAERAYQNLAGSCLASGVALLNMYGVDELAAHAEYENARFLTRNALRLLADSSDILMFETVQGFLGQNNDTLEDPSPQMADLCRYAADCGQPVLFSLRKSFPADAQIAKLKEVLEKEDIRLPGRLEDHLIVLEGEDASFRRVAEDHPGKKICYFCSGLVNEFLLPRAYGYHTVHVVPYDYRETIRNLSNLPADFRFPETVSFEDALKAAEDHDVVSFDIFDTILIRKVLRPEDIFLLTEQAALRAIGPAAAGFAAARIRASQEVPRAEYTVWYGQIARELGLSQQDADALRELELLTERKFLTVREPVIRLMQELHGAGKEIILVSDMYLPEPVLRALLEEQGVTVFDRIFVSCDHGKFKSDGLFRDVRKAVGIRRTILHFGDDIRADRDAAGAAGADFLLLPSPYRTACDTGWKFSAAAAKTLADRCLLGACIAACFADPFLPADRSRYNAEQKLRYLAHAVCAPVLLGYLFDLVRRLKRTHYDKVLFSARDGWLLKDFYDLLRRTDPALPESVYFYCSRHSSFLTCADREDLVPAAAASFPKLTAEELLRNMYELDLPDTPEDRARRETLRKSCPKPDPVGGDAAYLLELFRLYEPRLRAQAAECRARWRRYLERAGIRPGDRCVLMDFVSVGNTQYFLREGLGMDLDGAFIGLPDYSSYRTREIPVSYFLTGETNDAFRLFNSYMEMEYIMTSPEPSLDGFDVDGNPVFAAETRMREELDEVSRVHGMLRAFMTDFIERFYEDGFCVSREMIEWMFDAADLPETPKQAYDDWSKSEIRR